jgi:hypothetical protein
MPKKVNREYQTSTGITGNLDDKLIGDIKKMIGLVSGMLC